jgi:hypothetical protein
MLEQSKIFLNNIPGQVQCKVHVDMKLNYISSLSIHCFGETVLCSEWPEYVR